MRESDALKLGSEKHLHLPRLNMETEFPYSLELDVPENSKFGQVDIHSLLLYRLSISEYPNMEDLSNIIQTCGPELEEFIVGQDFKPEDYSFIFNSLQAFWTNLQEISFACIGTYEADFISFLAFYGPKLTSNWMLYWDKGIERQLEIVQNCPNMVISIRKRITSCG